MIQCLCKRKSLQATQNLTWPTNTYYLPSPVPIYQIQNSPKRVRWPFPFHGTHGTNVKVPVRAGVSLQHHALITWSSPLLPWLARQKTLLLLKNSTIRQIHYREDTRVKSNYQNAATLEAKLLKFNQNLNEQSYIYHWNSLDSQREENNVWLVLTPHLLGFWAVYALCTFYTSIYTRA